MPQEALAKIRGIPHIPSITEINVRSGPGTNHDLIFRIPVGSSGLSLLEVAEDAEQKALDTKVYQWFKLMFHGGAVGWVRDDLLMICGDCSTFGYPTLSEDTWAFELIRHIDVTSHHTITSIPSPEQPAPIRFTPVHEDLDRVRSLAFMITSAFEGTGYASYNNFDAGIVSYGFIQFTLASGSLWRVLDLYVKRANSNIADQLRRFMGRVQQRDPSLRHDITFRDLLFAAAKEPPMKMAQEQVAQESYWKQVVEGYILHRELQMPLSWALLFDMGVNFGVNHGFVRLAEKNLNVAPRSKPGENGISEIQLIEEVAKLRKASHDRQATRDNLPGLRVRGDFWIERVRQQDWDLKGDGQQLLVNGRVVEVN